MPWWSTALAIIVPVTLGYFLFWRGRFDPETLRGKRVLVTGASSGIGESVAYKYAQLGVKLVITARRQQQLNKVAKKCQELGAESVHVIAADMAIAQDRSNLVTATKSHLGGLDILILNHGLMTHSWWKGTPEDLSELDTMMTVDFYSYAELTAKFLDDLTKSNGNIGVVSSLTGKFGTPGLASYSASKHALDGFYSALRHELRISDIGVSVTLMIFGPVNTEAAVKVANKMKSLINFQAFAGSPDDAADAFIKGVWSRSSELYFPLAAQLLQLAYKYSLIDFVDIFFRYNFAQ